MTNVATSIKFASQATATPRFNRHDHGMEMNYKQLTKALAG